MNRLAIVGSRDLGQLVAHHAVAGGQHVVAGFLDDFRPRGELAGPAPVLGALADLRELHARGEFDCLMIAIGYRHPAARRACFDAHAGPVPLATLVHRSCFVDATARIGAGSFLLPGCTVDLGGVVEENVVLNTGCTLAHDAIVRRHTFLGPGVVVAGFVDIGESCFIGAGTVLVDHVRLAPGVQTGAGTVVTEDLLEPGLYVGAPARKVR